MLIKALRSLTYQNMLDYVEPYFNKHRDGLHGYFYIPPKEACGYSAVALKGNKAHISFDIFKSYMKSGAMFHKELVKDLIDRLLDKKLLISKDLPST